MKHIHIKSIASILTLAILTAPFYQNAAFANSSVIRADGSKVYIRVTALENGKVRFEKCGPASANTLVASCTNYGNEQGYSLQDLEQLRNDINTNATALAVAEGLIAGAAVAFGGGIAVANGAAGIGLKSAILLPTAKALTGSAVVIAIDAAAVATFDFLNPFKRYARAGAITDIKKSVKDGSRTVDSIEDYEKRLSYVLKQLDERDRRIASERGLAKRVEEAKFRRQQALQELKRANIVQ